MQNYLARRFYGISCLISALLAYNMKEQNISYNVPGKDAVLLLKNGTPAGVVNCKTRFHIYLFSACS